MILENAAHDLVRRDNMVDVIRHAALMPEVQG